MGSRPSAPSTEIIQEPQRPTITQTAFSREGILSLAGLGQMAQDKANMYRQSMYDIVNAKQPEDQKLIFEPDETDYVGKIEALPIMNQERLEQQFLEDQEIRKQQEKEKRQKERKDNKSEREKYADTLAVTQMRPAGGAGRMIGGG